jgi:hypothetical protein
MSLTFNLPALLDLGIAAACVRGALRETGNRPVMLWKLGIAPLLGTVVAIILLAGTPSNRMLEAAWVGAAIVGGALGAVMGNRARTETDQMWGLVRLQPTYVGVAAAVCILAVTMVDSLTTLLGYPPAPARYDPAIGGALFAGFLVGRVWRMAAKAIRSSHVELHNL